MEQVQSLIHGEIIIPMDSNANAGITKQCEPAKQVLTKYSIAIQDGRIETQDYCDI